jgi:alpha-tubulin suppressor-like RCC1 family protein
MNFKLRHLILVVAAMLLLVSANYSAAQSNNLNLCEPRPLVLYINGVGVANPNEQVLADTAASAIADNINHFSVPCVGYVWWLYNPTDIFFLDDLAESAKQKATELGISFAEGLLRVGLSVHHCAATPSPLCLSQADQDSIIAKITARIQQIALGVSFTINGNTYTTAGLVDSFRQIVAPQLAGGRKVVLLAHSQGNFFANSTYLAIQASASAADFQRLKVVNVANASANSPNNLWVTAKQDRMMGLLRLITGLPVANFDAQGAHSLDWTGHGFKEVYMSRSLPTGQTAADSIGAHVMGLLKSALGYPDAANRLTSGSHSCVITTAGGVKCWGSNWFGNLGDGTQTSSAVPVDVVGLSSGVTAISARGWSTCVLTSTGGAKCWGDDQYGQLGGGAYPPIGSRLTHSTVPMDVVGLGSGVTAISVGNTHACALTNAGGVKCWGFAAMLGSGDSAGFPPYNYNYSPAPVDVVGLGSGVDKISTRNQTTCALTNAGGVKCWGDNSYGNLGDGTYSPNPFFSDVPVDVVGLSSGVTAISVGNTHACALTSIGGTKCWGDNRRGQLGDGTRTSSAVPVDVVGLSSGVTAISSGAESTCVLTSTGGTKCWGDDRYGQLGGGINYPGGFDAAYSTVPMDVSGLSSGVTAIDSGEISCALTGAGGVKCWGFNVHGFLGVNSTQPYVKVPMDVVAQ